MDECLSLKRDHESTSVLVAKLLASDLAPENIPIETLINSVSAFLGYTDTASPDVILSGIIEHVAISYRLASNVVIKDAQVIFTYKSQTLIRNTLGGGATLDRDQIPIGVWMDLRHTNYVKRSAYPAKGLE